MAKKESFQDKDTKTLGKELAAKRAELRKLRFDRGGKTNDVKQAQNTKKTVARLLTELRRRV